MVEANILIYALSGLIVVLAGLLTTRAIKRRKNKPENIWATKSAPAPNYTQRIPITTPIPPPPIAPPPAHLFSNR